MENQKAKLQNWKKTGSKINGEKKESRKGKNMGKKWTCPFDVFCIYFAFLICFFLKLLFCICFAFFQAKSKIHAKKTNWENNCKKHQMDKSFCFSLFDFFPCFFPFILLLCFLDFADLVFVFSVSFFAFVLGFFKFVDS